jgi:ketosteroid isomerase-like protein
MIKLAKRLIWAFLITGLLISCQTTTDNETEVLAVEQVLSKLIEADNRGDLEGAMNHYSRDVVLMPPDTTSIIGWDAVKAHYRTLFQNFQFINLKAIPEETSVSQDVAIVAGTTGGIIQAKNDSSSQEFQDKFMMLFRKNDRGTWKINRLIWNDID